MISVKKRLSESEFLDTPLFSNKGTEENLDYHPIRGTDNNENLYRLINALNLHLCGPELQDAEYTQYLFRDSHNKRLRSRRLDLIAILFV